jgi:hypothetical protein
MCPLPLLSLCHTPSLFLNEIMKNQVLNNDREFCFYSSNFFSRFFSTFPQTPEAHLRTLCVTPVLRHTGWKSLLYSNTCTPLKQPWLPYVLARAQSKFHSIHGVVCWVRGKKNKDKCYIFIYLRVNQTRLIHGTCRKYGSDRTAVYAWH